jgi:hypothetical protein
MRFLWSSSVLLPAWTGSAKCSCGGFQGLRAISRSLRLGLRGEAHGQPIPASVQDRQRSLSSHGADELRREALLQTSCDAPRNSLPERSSIDLSATRSGRRRAYASGLIFRSKRLQFVSFAIEIFRHP